MFRCRYTSIEHEAPQLLDKWLGLRRHMYLVLGFIETEHLDADGAYVDAYDACSEHVLMWDETVPKAPVGTCRIIDGRRDPLQVHNQLGVLTSADALDVSGFAVVPEYRKTFVTLGCYWIIHQRALVSGYDQIHLEIAAQAHAAGHRAPVHRDRGAAVRLQHLNNPVCSPTLDVAERTPTALLDAGRRLLRAWVTVTAAGFSYQPYSIAIDSERAAAEVSHITGVANPIALFRMGRTREAARSSNRKNLDRVLI